ncbi:xylulokinase [Fictibacillus terranigra]|uniref:FGGY family carbohydrate kinase n=1 Tax=Fictibacillus terranigra TaxID=3058424 RepID=A0ABT8EDL6_9BACL|nr:FGGY family carbohydrate kinase [Fictibacillus sp. CENA-BCM004]MDN4075907.1 FGGY family carbohydrate kinase [Fictibacillus sp. CENA-BCM004]
MSHIIGIDIGTSGIKVGAMNKEGALEFLEFQPLSLVYPLMGWVEIDLEDTWNKTKTLLLKVWEQVDTIGSVDAISLSTFCNSSVFLNEKGDPLYPGIVYLDQRSRDESELIKETVGKELLFNITKNRIEPGMYTVTTHLWFKNHYPDLYQQTYKWGNLSTFILHKLTGNFLMDWTQCSYTGIFDIEKYNWSPEIYEKVGIDARKLPEVVDPSSVIGNFLPDFSSYSIPVIAGAADTACSAAALGLGVNEMFESVGTSNVLTVCTDQPDCLDKRFLNRCHVMKNRWLSHGAMSFPGLAIQWFYEQFLKPEGHSKRILEDLPKQSIAGANGVFFLPYMQGERVPIWDTNARGVFVGIHLNTVKADMYRAILEGCSYGLRQINEIIEECYKLQAESMSSIGGGSKNREWAQIKANVLEKKIKIKAISETGVLGACIIAGTAIGYFSSLEEAATAIGNGTIYTAKPEVGMRETYSQLYHIFNELYPSLKTFFAISTGQSAKGGVQVETNHIYNEVTT